MISLSIIILLVGQAVIVSGGTLESLNGGKVVNVIEGESVELKWNVSLVSNEDIQHSGFFICLQENEKNCIAQGISNTFVAVKNTAYENRIETSLNGTVHILKIKEIEKKKEDNGLKLYITAIFRKSASEITNIESDTVTINVKAYPKLLRYLESSLYFNEDDKPTVEITASGIPRPNVTWKFNGQSSEGSYTDNGDDEYTYKYTLPPLTRNLCGYKLDYIISGWGNIIITNTSTVIVKFKPKVTVKLINNTIIVSWDANKYGNCSVPITIDVLDKDGNVLQNKTSATSPINFTFDAEVKQTISTIRWNSSYHGTQSVVATVIPVLPTSPPKVTPTPTTDSSSSSNIAVIVGVVAGLIVIIIIIVVIVIYLKRKNKKNSRSAIGSSQGTENSYNHVPLDRRDGAEENNYTSVPSSKPSSRADDPDQMLYAELGAGGGRTGPKPAPEQSNYAVVKVDEMGYPARGPTSDKKSQPTYAAVNRDQSRRHSPPPPDDDNEGVIV